MRTKPLLFGAALLLSTLALTWHWSRPSTESTEPPATLEAPIPQAADSDEPDPIAANSEQQQLLNSPQARDLERRLAFQNQYRSFVQQAGQPEHAARQSEAERLSKRIDTLEAQGELALSEALLMQLGLIRATESDEATQKMKAQRLIERYQQISAEREARLAAQPDPNFERYKAEEKRIVEEVLALQSIPDGLSRDEYLRQRLQEARERSFQ
ncbi:hypothetical protein [Ectopseudomonas mendocina]|uniref:Lipase modulator n=1 Tax=Ectopseudomonas mendocina TaxID=300 RepID=A0A2R3QUN6_ECTME|nr:hypothetical protein [Pseudomonas mendocina]AVO55509.1 hypothetical protein C7A17_23010 [Pseudomonas mendocina]